MKATSMRMLAVKLYCASILAVSAQAEVHAQVISGESTYEDNFVHTPPPAEAEKPGDHDPSKSADPASSYAPSRTERERERN